MAATPYKPNVHWALDISMSEFGSPFSTASSSDVSSSTLQYLNSQLVAHGFTSSPGLSLESLSNTDSERVVKCILGMLSQRVEDMERTEDLTTKLRTLSYDHERLMGMHRTATEKAANAERETNVHKSRLTAATRTLQSTETAHKHTTAELQRTRTSLQALRLTHQSELKKKELQVERMQEKWAKLADVQAKLNLTGSGMTCANAGVVEGSEILGKGRGYMEVALEQAEEDRLRLSDENTKLRRLVLTALNEAQSVLHLARGFVSDNEDEPTPFTLTTLFPLHPQTTASDKLTSIIAALRESISLLSRTTPPSPSTSDSTSATPNGELERLQSIIDTLRAELDQAQKASVTTATETRALFDQFTADHLALTRTTNAGNDEDVGEMSMDLMTAPAKDQEKERLDCMKRELDEERKKFTEAAVRLGRERAAMEAERIKFLDEKRSWQVEMMLADLPPTPHPLSSPVRAPSANRSPYKSPRKSPTKPKSSSGIVVGKVGSGRKIRVSRRSSLASPTKNNVESAYETEVLPPIAAPLFTSTRLSIPPLGSSLLPTSFVLPPPSPNASLPTQPAILTPPSTTSSSTPEPQSSPDVEAQSQTSTASASPTTPPGPTFRRPFPVAKPFAQRMVHAYSPAKPSPLSRILMLGNSPASPTSDADSSGEQLGVVVEEDEELEGELFPAVAVVESAPSPPSLVDLEVEKESGRESPLREKKIESNVTSTTTGTAATAKGRVFHPEPKRFSAKEKGKGKAEPTTVVGRPRTNGVVEKENKTDALKRNKEKPPAAPPARAQGTSVPGAVAGTNSRVSAGGVGDGKKGTKPAAVMPKPGASTGGSGMSTSRARLMAKLPPPAVKGGARRVPVDSAEAPPVGKGWRG